MPDKVTFVPETETSMSCEVIDQLRINASSTFAFSILSCDSGLMLILFETPVTPIKFLTTFLYSWSRPSDIDELLLPDIETVLNEKEIELENGSETIQIIIYLDLVTFYPEQKDTFSIPTLEFKEIIIGWRDFLLESPLNGTKI